MATLRRQLLQIKKRTVTQGQDQKPRWLVLHFSYSDGGEVYEARTIQGVGTYRRFATESELQGWLRKFEHTVVD